MIAALVDLFRPAPGPTTIAVVLRDGLLVTTSASHGAVWDGILTAAERKLALAELERAEAYERAVVRSRIVWADPKRHGMGGLA